jgi:hypothetical protein
MLGRYLDWIFDRADIRSHDCGTGLPRKLGSLPQGKDSVGFVMAVGTFDFNIVQSHKEPLFD